MNAEKLKTEIERVEVPTRYDMKLGEMQLIRATHDNKPAEAILDAFHLGFSRGQKAAKAEADKKATEKRQREMKKEAPGCGLLWALIQKNMSNEQFVSRMCARARNLDTLLNKEVPPHD